MSKVDTHIAIRTRGTMVRYLVAVGSITAAAAVNAAMWPSLGSSYPLIAFFPAIALSSWFGGLGPGLLATTLSGAGATYIWFAPGSFARPSHQGAVLALTLLAGVGVTIAALFESVRRRTQLAERLAGELRGSQARLREVEAVARRLDQLLDMVRVSSMSMPLEYASVELCCVLRNAWELTTPDARAKGVAMRLDIDPDAASEPFFGDSARLQQIVTNLLSNGVKFTPTGGEVLLKVLRRDDTLEIVVSDTGVGIPKDFLPLIFEPFRRVDTSNRYSGFGLGLSIVKRLVEAHGGDISAASDGPNRGARFAVRLPVSINRRADHVGRTELGRSGLRG